MCVLEVIVTNKDDAVRAQELGAGRLELVADINVGGVQPSIDDVRLVLEAVSIPVNVMVRNKSESFVYNDDDVKAMVDYIREIKKFNPNGFVFGSLTPDGKVELDVLKVILKETEGFDFTFHRAIDEAYSQLRSTVDINGLKGITSILTSGGMEYDITRNIHILKEMSIRSDYQIILGGGVKLENMEFLLMHNPDAQIHMGSGLYVDGDYNLGLDSEKFNEVLQTLGKLEFRDEYDSLGTIKVCKNAYYGAQTKRAYNNFVITKRKPSKEFNYAIVKVKQAAIEANYISGILSKLERDAMMEACSEIIKGMYDDMFITDTIQGGAGTSFNMNVNEVIANRANEILGGTLGSYDIIHPNDHVNLSQSTNDVIPTAIKVALVYELTALKGELRKLRDSYKSKELEFDSVIKMGRTHLQDAVPIKLGQEFGAFAASVTRDVKRIDQVIVDLQSTNLGATAVGTGINSSVTYINNVVDQLNIFTGLEFRKALNYVDETRNADIYMEVSSCLKMLAANTSKVCNDLRIMASGPNTGFGEIILPQRQPGSSIMPGKVNPVVPEVVNQICFKVYGSDLTVSKAVEAGQLELNVFLPVVQTELFESINLLKNGSRTLRLLAIDGILANREYCLETLEKSAGLATALAPIIGYERASVVAKRAVKERISIKDLVRSEGLLTEEEIELVLDVNKMTRPND